MPPSTVPLTPPGLRLRPIFLSPLAHVASPRVVFCFYCFTVTGGASRLAVAVAAIAVSVVAVAVVGDAFVVAVAVVDVVVVVICVLTFK